MSCTWFCLFVSCRDRGRLFHKLHKSTNFSSSKKKNWILELLWCPLKARGLEYLSNVANIYMIILIVRRSEWHEVSEWEFHHFFFFFRVTKYMNKNHIKNRKKIDHKITYDCSNFLITINYLVNHFQTNKQAHTKQTWRSGFRHLKGTKALCLRNF